MTHVRVSLEFDINELVYAEGVQPLAQYLAESCEEALLDTLEHGGYLPSTVRHIVKTPDKRRRVSC